uniref:Uncharacterized protein n=1 Tax=Anguilla anguilla TaxID=7936 RepID=A0A0E9WRM7_ANGAN
MLTSMEQWSDLKRRLGCITMNLGKSRAHRRPPLCCVRRFWHARAGLGRLYGARQEFCESLNGGSPKNHSSYNCLFQRGLQLFNGRPDPILAWIFRKPLLLCGFYDRFDLKGDQ